MCVCVCVCVCVCGGSLTLIRFTLQTEQSMTPVPVSCGPLVLPSGLCNPGNPQVARHPTAGAPVNVSLATPRPCGRPVPAILFPAVLFPALLRSSNSSALWRLSLQTSVSPLPGSITSQLCCGVIHPHIQICTHTCAHVMIHPGLPVLPFCLVTALCCVCCWAEVCAV